jgi:RHS repeat-associated protein
MKLNTLLKSIITLVLLALLPSVTTAATETITWIHTDHLGSPIAGRNAAGETTWEQAYAPWGEKQAVAGVPQASAGVGYTGHIYDEQMGLVYAGARWYDPAMGRFLSPDAVRFHIEDVAHFNRYAYANSNPFIFVDPDGRDSAPLDKDSEYDLGLRARRGLGAAVVSEGASKFGHTVEDNLEWAIPGGIILRGVRLGPGVAKGVTRSLDDLSSLRGAKLSDVEKMADAKYLQQGWTKSALRDGNGIRYFDGKGNSFQLNKGYPGGKEMHGGPYIKTTQGNQTVRIPLEGNPDL